MTKLYERTDKECHMYLRDTCGWNPDCDEICNQTWIRTSHTALVVYNPARHRSFDVAQKIVEKIREDLHGKHMHVVIYRRRGIVGRQEVSSTRVYSLAKKHNCDLMVDKPDEAVYEEAQRLMLICLRSKYSDF